ncbi:MAG: hypothetical protein JWR37_796 [Mycobacterium sp.]|nr:hypothetical protein [Mycobacterium sp.]
MIGVTTPSLVWYGFHSLSFTSTSPLIDVMPAALTSPASLSSPANGSAATGFTLLCVGLTVQADQMAQLEPATNRGPNRRSRFLRFASTFVVREPV